MSEKYKDDWEYFLDELQEQREYIARLERAIIEQWGDEDNGIGDRSCSWCGVFYDYRDDSEFVHKPDCLWVELKEKYKDE